jgi:hypothetical protein
LAKDLQWLILGRGKKTEGGECVFLNRLWRDWRSVGSLEDLKRATQYKGVERVKARAEVFAMRQAACRRYIR